MSTVGVRELRQKASELVRQVEAGEVVTVTVSGRPVARLVPVEDRRMWRTFDEVADIFTGRPDTHWREDRDLLDGYLQEPRG